MKTRRKKINKAQPVEVDVILMERVVLNGFDAKHSNVIIILYLFIQLCKIYASRV